jgi:hypothetical protein
MRYSAMSLLPALAAASPMMQTGTIHKDAAPILSSTQAKEVPNSYMVVFKKHVKESHAKEHHDWVQSIHTKSESERMELRKRSQFPITTEVFDGLKHTYNIIGGMVGYSGHFDEETIEAIRRHPDVSSNIQHSIPAYEHELLGLGLSVRYSDSVGEHSQELLPGGLMWHGRRVRSASRRESR